MPEPAPRIHLFARDWDHAAWSDSFYPQDLPEDWRLTYYANEFPGVLVPAERWQAADEAELLDWVDDVHAGFRFFVEQSQPDVTEADETRAALLGSCFAGWVMPEHESAREGVTACRLPAMQAGYRAFLLDADALGDLKMQRQLLERLTGEAGEESDLLLFLQGDSWPVERLRQLTQLSQLLGLA